MNKLIATLMVLVCFGARAATTSSITQFGITVNFSSPVTYGTFANGDYWIVEPATVSSMTPDWDGTKHGWEINPTFSTTQSFYVVSGSGYTAAKRPSMPFDLEAGETLVKTIGRAAPDDWSYVDRVIAITTLASAPSGGGELYFRPPYSGTEKPLIPIADIRWDLLPDYELTSGAPTLAEVADRFSRGVRMTHHDGDSRKFRPRLAMWGYQPNNTPDLNNAMLRLMGQDSAEAKASAMIHFTQNALDMAYVIKQGFRRVDDGHSPNWRILAAWAAVMLDLDDIKTYLATADGFHEDRYLYRGVTDIVLWGEPNTEYNYWAYLVNDSGSRSNKDPYGYIDGGRPVSDGARYQRITSQSLKGQSLIYRLFPQLAATVLPQRIVNLNEYAERWVTNGVWTLPDPAAPYDGNWANYGVTFGPNGSGSYIAGSGRRTTFHAADPDAGDYASAFVSSMWSAYVDGYTPPAAPTLTSATVAANGQTVTVVWSEAVSTSTGWTGSNITINDTSSGSNFALTLSSGSGTATWTMTTGGSVYVYDSASPTLSFDGVADAIENAALTDVAAFSNTVVTNNSTYPQPPLGPAAGAGAGKANGLMLIP